MQWNVFIHEHTHTYAYKYRLHTYTSNAQVYICLYFIHQDIYIYIHLSLSLHRHLQESSQRLKASQAQWHEGAGQPKICVSHFSKVSPFATKITINQISSNIKPNQVKPAWNWNQLKSCGYICQVPGAPRCIYMLHVAIVGKTQGTNQILPRKAGSTTTHRETGSSGGLWGEAPGTEWGERRYAKELPSCNQRNSIEKYVCCNVLYII